MNTEILKQAVELAKKTGYLFVATADSSGLPHIAVSGKIEISASNRVSVSAWFCPGTIANQQVNKRISLVIWDAKTDTGYQLLGESEKIEDLAVLDGYAADIEGKKTPLPQVHRRLVVCIDKIIDFKRAPHSDTEE